MIQADATRVAPRTLKSTVPLLDLRAQYAQIEDEVVQVLRELAGGVGLDAKVNATGAQCVGDSGEHQVRPRLVVHRVEGGDEVEPARLAEPGDSASSSVSPS